MGTLRFAHPTSPPEVLCQASTTYQVNNSMNKAMVKQFFDNWSIYDKVLAHNYMFHDAIYRDVQHFITSHYADRPFALIDLGCGSAYHVAYALTGSPIARYIGYDLSDLALAHATRNLAGLGRLPGPGWLSTPSSPGIMPQL